MPVIEDHINKEAGSEGRTYCACGRGNSTGSFGGETAEDQYPPSLEIEPTHLAIGLRLDLPAERLDGRVVHTLLGNRDGARTLTLNAVDFLDVKVPGSGHKHSYDGNTLEIVWDKPFAKGERRELEITYRVEKPVTGLFFMQPSAEYPGKALYAATDHETERARYWLPTVDLPNVRTTLDFQITAAEPLTILANGALVKEVKNKDGTKTAHWRLDQRCPSYLVCFAVGDFSRFDDAEFEGMPVAAFAAKEFSTKDLERTFGRTRAILAWMTKRLGVKFPFPKYYQFALPAFGGAMENISLVSWSDEFMCTEKNAGEATWLTDQVNVHEMAHSYFGDLVVCRDFAHAWLKESWATYMETCWLEDSKGEDEQLYDLHQNALAYFDEADSRYSRPLVTRRFTSSWQMYDRHLYPGGACRLHTLRKELGDDCFWAGVNDYLSTFREKVVETDDFRKMLEKHSGRSLQKLFDQWVHSAGYPDLKVTFSYDKEKQLGTFEVEQKQVKKKQGHQGRVFELSTDLGWTVGGKAESMPIKITKARQSFNVRLEKDPEQVRFDPLWKVLHKLEFNPGETKLKKQLVEAKDVIGRIHAARALCEAGKREGIRAVVEAYGKEKFWGVRKAMLKALAESNSEDALKGLIGFAATEKDHMVLAGLFGALGGFRDIRVKQAVQTRLEKGDLPPQARAAALTALGRQREAAPVDVLTKACAETDPQSDMVQAAAFFALGLTRSEDAAPYLAERSVYGKAPFRGRKGTVRGMAAMAPYLAKGPKARLEERLVDLLRDPEPWIRMEAARGLKAASVRASIPQLEAYRSTLPLQEQVAVDAMMKDLTKDEDAKVPALEKQLDELKERYRKINDRVQDLEDKLK